MAINLFPAQIAEYFGYLTPSFSPTIFQHKPGIILACKIAAKASFRRKYIFALHKFFISCRLHCNHWIDLDPSHSPNIPLSLFTNDHLRYAYAIMIAYSIIEELGLHVHASSNNPSLLSDGNWNPKVRQNLEKRLLDAGIDISETISWNVRGKIKTLERRVERRKKIRPVIKAEWAYGDVRDCQIDILDAINDLSWIRNTFTAHKVDKDIKKLSIYDVDNAQHLARRLLLETMGFWQVQRS